MQEKKTFSCGSKRQWWKIPRFKETVLKFSFQLLIELSLKEESCNAGWMWDSPFQALGIFTHLKTDWGQAQQIALNKPCRWLWGTQESKKLSSTWIDTAP